MIELADSIDASANPDMEIYNSEWNAQSTDWRTGLFVATRSEDGRTIVIKAVDPIGQTRSVEVNWNGDFAPKMASTQSVAPGSLRARNTLADPTAVRVEMGAVQLNGQSVRIEPPAYSAAVLRVN